MYDYFFAGNQYIRVTRTDTGPGVVDAGYPRAISPNWGWGSFGANGIDAALYSGSKCYFFAGKEYIRTTRGTTGPGTIDPGYPKSIAANWGWGSFGANGIDAALFSNSKCYFFSGKEYIRVTRGETGPGTVDAGYPRPISVWGWGSFGANGIDAALYSGSRCYFFSGDQYIRVTRADEGAGTVDAGYPKPISSNWGWGSFGGKGISAALNSAGPYAPVPAKGLGSNSNYFLYSPAKPLAEAAEKQRVRVGPGVPILTWCNHLRGLQVHIIVDTDITGTSGFGFQINAYSASQAFDGAQQYVVLLIPDATSHVLDCMVDNWHTKHDQVVNIREPLATLPSNTLPAGYQIIITLLNDEADNVIGASYVLIDNHGNTVGNRTISLSNQPAQNLAPIVAFQLNFVGDINGATTTLSSGAGTMTYTASNLMSVLDTEPQCVDWTFSTVEAANSMYSLLPSAPSQTFTQSFGLSVGGVVIHRKAEVEHRLVLRQP
ncbi:hemopexin repeat-containing protein [Dyella sp. C11]|uniref:hemopexin repeat-containing protein n=1 Tax=Dyella sp. C11 TaxID=2126991 RepID=UPI0018E56B38|nr:hemopexin repeat-containing protein [Dyella sp. C11]